MLSLPEFKEKVDAPLWRDLVSLAEEISGFPRHISQHVGGMIISSRPLVECVPLEKASMPGRVICQWDKDSCEDARFIKVDFLALGMLSLVEECVELIAEGRPGEEPLDLSRISFDDPAVYDQISAGDTVGVFQIESRAQIQLLPRTQPRNLDELAIEIAIIRPGPIIGGAVHPYVERRAAQRRALKEGKEYSPALRPPPLGTGAQRDARRHSLSGSGAPGGRLIGGFYAGPGRVSQESAGEAKLRRGCRPVAGELSCRGAKKGRP